MKLLELNSNNWNLVTVYSNLIIAKTKQYFKLFNYVQIKLLVTNIYKPLHCEQTNDWS